MEQDIVLITIDCLRHDAPQRMPHLQQLTEEYQRTNAICHAAATNGVFPGILNSLYYPHAYDQTGDVKSGTAPLPAVLRENGYTTGAFLASNPYLTKWKRFFDSFWNGSETKEHVKPISTVKKAANLTLLRQEVTVSEVAARAQQWYSSQTDPTFLWIHLMEPHTPYYPGLRQGIDEGLFQTYRSLITLAFDSQRTAETLSPETQTVLRNLYWRCIDQLDQNIQSVFRFLDPDATVFVMADHGEEFDHGVFSHARLYDECVRVPLFVKWTLNSTPSFRDTVVRQIDLPPTIVDGLGLTCPDHWVGDRISETSLDPAFMLSHTPLLNEQYVGVRTNEKKLIKTYAENGDLLNTEAYDLAADPAEKQDRYRPGEFDQLENQLAGFLAEPEIQQGIVQEEGDLTPAVEQRLKELGYK